MDKKSLKGLAAEKAVRTKETDSATSKLAKTEAEAVKVANQVGAIDSGLSDINERLREARNRVLDSAGKAGSDDSKKVTDKVKGVREHRSSVEAVERKTSSERQKADQVRPADSRIKDGSELANVLRNASGELSSIAKALGQTERNAEAQKQKSEAAIKDAVRRNRK
jgi:hypothetical protein